MAAVSIGCYFGIKPEDVENAISGYLPDNNRSQWIRTERNVLLLDAYNANPSSMKAALNNFHGMDAPRKMIILGDMMELGEYGREEHLDIIELTRALSFKNVYVIGELFSRAAAGGNETCFAGIREAEKWFHENPVNDMTILLKGSRVMQLETLINLL